MRVYKKPKMKKYILLLIALIEVSFLMAGNPIMGIRCRGGGAIAAQLQSNVAVEVDAFAPDCAGLASCVESCSAEDLYWNPEALACGCDIELDEETLLETPTGYFSACGCPEGLGSDSGLPIYSSPNPDDEDPEYVNTCIPYEDCFDGDISFEVQPFVCDAASAEDVIISVVITADGGGPLPEGEFITIQSLINCDLIDEDDVVLLELLNQFGGDVSAAFEVGASGEVLIEFTRDPLAESFLDFGDYGTLTIPACPKAFDPCECGREGNIVAADGTIEYWIDTLTIVGTAGAPLTLNNLSPNGFLETPGTAYTALPAIGGDGTVKVPFYVEAGATSGVPTSITYNYAMSMGMPVAFMNTCPLANTACIADPIPTLGEWSIMILAISLMIIGVIYYRKTWYDRLQKEKIRNRN